MPPPTETVRAAILDLWLSKWWVCVLAAPFCALTGCAVQQDAADIRTATAEDMSQLVPNPSKIKSAVARWEQWIKQTDPDTGKVKFRCDLRKTDSLMSPYVATCGYWLFDDVEIEYTLAQQEGKWVFTKGTWTAHHSGGRTVVTDHNGGSERDKLEEFLNE